ncbi:small CPxCG-related zinc finger protein [Natrialba magadii ATCC 43099]|uniref:Small CPxCG-related zinc finger protein n=1 Tax=Natrialba magadii (strain ATCC 43099 / DSM 3394 / CCM 3739 / CIP 104546 / IAM 13178 / JCM 8861 / NBRC 102185 / NCIMB 2190 / MS3) TaxID=547559 RepID=D3SUA2_NATMM|nr:hypothetical protein [Natrialba magadii]ADD05160.2 small CPxCG-related zinc finger protein [Natrialba magadii ATCC 43099]
MTDDATLSSFGTDADSGSVSERERECESESESESESAPELEPEPDSTSASTDDSQVETDTAEADAADADPHELTPSLATYAVQPPGAEPAHTCEQCDTVSRRLWRDDGRFVCPECKVW